MPSIKTWTGALTKVYETAGNWSSAGKPGSGDQVVIDSGSWTQGPPNAPIGAETVLSLTLQGSAFTFAAGATISVATVSYADGARATGLTSVTALTLNDAFAVYAEGTITFGASPTITLAGEGWIASIQSISGTTTIVAPSNLAIGLGGNVLITGAAITVGGSALIGNMAGTGYTRGVTGTITGPGTATDFCSQLNNDGTLTVTGFGPAYKVGVGATQVGTYASTITIPAVGQVSNGVHFGPDGGLTGTAGPGMINIGAGS